MKCTKCGEPSYDEKICVPCEYKIYDILTSKDKCICGEKLVMMKCCGFDDAIKTRWSVRCSRGTKCWAGPAMPTGKEALEVWCRALKYPKRGDTE